MKKIYLGTNWKMHKTIKETEHYAETLISLTRNIDTSTVQLFIIPPYTALAKAREILKGSDILLGAQNMHWAEAGAYTGEISARMLKEIGIDIVELGHSERRQYYNEDDIALNKKVKTALKYNLNPLICIGEREVDKENDISEEIIQSQLKIIFHGINKGDLGDLWIAYEPVWAIGESGKPAQPAYAERIHSVIINTLEQLFDKETADKIPILYGGSVDQENCYSFLKRENVDGLFIGRAAWEATAFSSIVHLLLEEGR